MDIQIDVTNTKIETPRLSLRPWRESDLGDLYEYASADGVGEAAGWKHHESIEETRSVLHAFMTEKNILALELKSAKKAIGSVGLHYSWANGYAEFAALSVKEIGYVLSKSYWGQGLMSEAVGALIDYGFNTLELDALSVTHFLENNRSKRVIQKNGFAYVGRGEFISKSLNRTFPEDRYILLRSDYEKQRKTDF